MQHLALETQIFPAYSLSYIAQLIFPGQITEHTKELSNVFSLGSEETKLVFSFILKFWTARFSYSCVTASLIS